MTSVGWLKGKNDPHIAVVGNFVPPGEVGLEVGLNVGRRDGVLVGLDVGRRVGCAVKQVYFVCASQQL